MMQVEPEKERWRCIAKEWYPHGIADTPGVKLHHLRGRKRGATHSLPFRKKVRGYSVRTTVAQSRRSQQDATVAELFVLRGVLFTNIGAIMEYGRPSGVLRRAGGAGTRDTALTAPFRAVAERNLPSQPEEDPEERQTDVDRKKSSPFRAHAPPMLSNSPVSIQLS